MWIAKEEENEMKDKVFCKKCGHLCVETYEGDIKRKSCPDCGFIYYQNPFPCISTLVVDDSNRVLLGLRGKASIYADKWCLPCGYIEYNETYIEAACRETKEETGVVIRPKGIISVVSNQFENGVNSMVVTILAEPESQNVTAGDDIVEAGWFDLDSELPELAFEADQYIINEYKRAKEENRELETLSLLGGSFKAQIRV